MTILGIETSATKTSAAVVENSLTGYSQIKHCCFFPEHPHQNRGIIPENAPANK